VPAVQAVQSKFQIRNKKPYHSVYILSFTHRDQYFGTELLNILMEEYRNYLKRDHAQIAKDQLIYLEEKQEEICGKMSKAFDEYTSCLQENLKESGRLGLQQEIGEIAQDYRMISNKALALDLEWEWLSRTEADQKAFVFLDGSAVSRRVQEILSTISNLKQQRDLIELSLPSYRRAFDGEEYTSRKEELKAIRDRREAMHRLLQQVEQGCIIQERLFDPETSLEAWAARLNQSQEKEREDLAEYLTNYTRLLSMQEKILQEQIFYGSDLPSEFKGIDLATARNLFGDYNNKLDACAEAMGHLSRLREEIENYDFEISSLCAVLSDPLSQRLIAQASETLLKLKDEKHRSEKEGSRWTEELMLQKKILQGHIDQLYRIELLKFNMTQDKIAALQTLSLSCISGQISVMQEQLSDCIKDRKRSLSEERKILEGKMAQIRSQFSELPQKWRKEKWLNLRVQMGIKMVQALTDLVDSKTIASHLHHSESKPLDCATVPSAPIPPILLVKAFLGAFLAGFVSVSRSFLRAVLSGFPTSSEKLRAMRYPFLGEISSFCDGPKGEALGADLESLRQVSLLIDQPLSGKKVIGIIEGKGPDYSYALGEHLARMSLRPLLIRCDFTLKFKSQDLPGLLQVWRKEIEEPPIRKQQGYEVLLSGGYTPYGAEIIRSREFQHLLEKWKKYYDYILLISRSSLDSVESISPLSFCDKALVTVAGEPTEQLTPFLDWAYHENMCRLAFLTSGSL